MYLFYLLSTFKKIIFFIILIFIFPVLSFPQFDNKTDKSPAQTQKQIKKLKKQNDKAEKRAAEYGRKRHLAIQEQATRKRMKKNLRRSNKSMKRPK